MQSSFPNASMRLLHTAESGDAYDAEVEQCFGGELDDRLALQSLPMA
jgi:hypothetical protein